MTNINHNSGETGLEVAIIGMAGRFPGAGNIDEFWDNLKNGRETISFFSEEEVQARGVKEELYKNPNYVKARGLLENQEYFDAPFFNYTPIEAEIMDPQVRLFHECCWQALEHAGYDPSTYKKLIGLYAGASAALNWEAYHFFSNKIHVLGGYAASLLRKDYLCTKTSFKLGLRGPSFYMQTACSTSLLAIHLACQGLLSGECQMALAGGVALTHQGTAGYMYQEGTVGSDDGHCRAFDARAAGTIRGEGVGIVALKLLRRAVRDKDTIHAVIKGSAINNDGDRKVGFTAPSVLGQAEVIWAAQQMAEVQPESISYIETHGTGTRLGDPVEINALKKVFQENKKDSCALGSVKTNIGHLDTAAGSAGVIKTVLAMKHHQIPPSLHFETPNPEIDFTQSPFYVNAILKEWKSTGHPLRAGISSFGIGGTNVHIILEEWRNDIKTNSQIKSMPKFSGKGRIDSENPDINYRLIPLSAHSKPALERMIKNLAAYLESRPEIDWTDTIYTLQVGRKRFRQRLAFVSQNRQQFIDVLTNGTATASAAIQSKEDNRPVVFMFPGQGSQYVNMGLGLYRSEPVFKEEMDRCFKILKSQMDSDLMEILYPLSSSTATQTIDQTQNAQPLLFIFSYALSRLIIHWGIKPYAMIGHSIGEYVAACLAGVLSLEEALRLVYYRGQLMQNLPSGSMLSVPLTEEELKPFLTDDLSIAAINTTARSVVSGPHEAVNTLDKQLQDKGYETRILHTSHAFHSSMMDPILEKYIERVKDTKLKKPEIPYISNVSGTWITIEDALDPHYWGRHIRETVRYSEGLKELLKREDALFIEIGPGKVLSTFTTQHRDKKPKQLVINAVRHPKDDVSDRAYLLERVGQLWAYGAALEWKNFYSGQEQPHRIPLPVYPFDEIYYPSVVNFSELAPPSMGNVNSTGETAVTSREVIQEVKQERPALSTPYTPPGNDLEKALVSVFEQFFGIQPVGIRDNFYELGGDSLNAVQLAELARKAGIGIKFQQLLMHQDIHEICKQLSKSQKISAEMNLEDVVNHLAEKYQTPVNLRRYQYDESTYRVIFIENEPIEIKKILEAIKEKIGEKSLEGPLPYPNFVIFVNKGETIPESGPITEELLIERLKLKNRLEDSERDAMMEELKTVHHLTPLLKKNAKSIEYDVSPVQQAYLIPPYQSIAANFIYYSHIFTYPVESEEIRNIAAELMQRNPLLRSMIELKDNRYVIGEYSNFENIELPVIDISAYSPSIQAKITARMSKYLWEPIDVIDHVLFKAAVLKIDHSHIRLVILFNHLIFDGTSIAVLNKQLADLSSLRKTTLKALTENKPDAVHYRDYVEFMKAQDYKHIQLEEYLSFPDYIHWTEKIKEKFEIAEMKTEVFDLDISMIPGRYKDHYEEIVLLAYAKLICRLYGVDKAPITMVSNGRIYKDGKFNNIIGEFPDEIPVLLSFEKGIEPQKSMDNFVQYKRFIRENNFNFYNYMSKGYYSGPVQSVTLSPFVFNSLMGSYEILTRIRAEENDMRGALGNMETPFFYMGVLEDFYANRVGIRFMQNSTAEVKEKFHEDYSQLVERLKTQ